MATEQQKMSDTNQETNGLEKNSHAATVVLLGADTRMGSGPLPKDESLIAKEYWELNTQRKRLERRLDLLATELKRKTGQREAGGFLVNVTSSTTQRVDIEAVRNILGDATPMIASASVRLTVEVA